MINLTYYIKTKKIENKKIKNEERKKYKENICELEVIVFEAIIHNRTYFDLSFTGQYDLIKITDKLCFKRKGAAPWEYRIKINLLSLWKLKREIRKVKKWKIK